MDVACRRHIRCHFTGLRHVPLAAHFEEKLHQSDVESHELPELVEHTSENAPQAELADVGQEIPPREQQTPEALGEFTNAEIKKWWPIIKAANIRGE